MKKKKIDCHLYTPVAYEHTWIEVVSTYLVYIVALYLTPPALCLQKEHLLLRLLLSS